MGHNARLGKGRSGSFSAVMPQGSGLIAGGAALLLAARADAQTELVPSVSNAGVSAARLAANGTLELTLTDGQSLVLAADQFTMAADGSVVLADAVVEQIATLLGIEATGLGVTLLPVAGSVGVGFAVAGSGGGTDGPNTAAVVAGTDTGSVKDVSTLVMFSNRPLVTGGTLTVTDPDAGEAVFRPATVRGTYGEFTLTADGAWTYTAAGGQTAVRQLPEGKSLQDSFIAVTADGTQKTVTVTLIGTNNWAEIGGDKTGEVIEAADVVLSTGGKLTVSDIDRGEAAFQPATVVGKYGELSIKADGTWTYNVESSLIEHLDSTMTETEEFVVSTVDGTKETVTVTLVGRESPATILGEDTGALTEHGGARSVSGSLTVLDPDATQQHFNAETDIQGDHGTATIDSEGNWTYTLTTGGSGITGLQPGATVEDRFTVTSADGTTHEVVITVTGTAAFNEVELSTFSPPPADPDAPEPLLRASESPSEPPSEPAPEPAPATPAGFVINGIAEERQAGVIVASAGDVNGDGLDDLFVAELNSSSIGGRSEDSYVVFGKADGSPVELSAVKDGTGGFLIEGGGDLESRGVTISKLGDVNGDGKADLLVSTTTRDFEGGETGTVYVVYGKSDTDKVDLTEIAAGNGGFAITGLPVSELGITLAGGGDVNGDGFDDFVLGLVQPSGEGGGYSGGFGLLADPGDEPGDEPPGPDVPPAPRPGVAFVIFGGEDHATSVTDLDKGIGGFAIKTERTGDNFGLSAAIVGDVNGDGFDDVAIGAPKTTDGYSSVGGVSVIYGKDDTDAVNVDTLAETGDGFLITGGATGEQLGTSVAAAGDVNGDGFADIFIGSGPSSEPADPIGEGNPGDIPDPNAPLPNTIKMAYVVLGQGTSQTVNINPVPDDGNDDPEEGDGEDDPEEGDGEGDPEEGDGEGDPEGGGGDEGGFGVLNGSEEAYSGRVLAIGGPKGPQSWTISGAGDFDGDGFDDLVISVYRPASETDLPADPGSTAPTLQVTYVISGGMALNIAQAGGMAAFLNDSLSGNADATLIYQGALQDGLGRSVSAAGDVNGDGFDDIIIGAPNASPNGDSSGAAYVVYGRTYNPNLEGETRIGGTGDDALKSDVPEMVFVGGAGNDTIDGTNFATALSGGSGDDLLQLAFFTDMGRVDGGTGRDTLEMAGSGKTLDLTLVGNSKVQSIEVIDLGGRSNHLRIDEIEVLRLSESTNTLRVLGGEGDRITLSGLDWRQVGGLTEDGVTYDIFQSGNAIVEVATSITRIGGPIAPVVLTDAVSGPGGFLINGRAADAETGYSVSIIGDVNGDGLDDIAVGAPDESGSGVTYVVFGKSDGTTVDLSDVRNGIGGFAIIGERDGDRAGTAVSGLGDINGDGFDDILVSAPYYDIETAYDTYTDTGSIYVVYGKDNTGTVLLSDIGRGEGGIVIDGVYEDYYAGLSVSGAGDVNGDGIEDLLIGTPRSEMHGIDSGAAYVVFGGGEDKVIELDDLEGDTPTGGFAIHSVNVGSRAGVSVRFAGDVNGDGLDDVIIGAPRTDGRTGAAYVVFGKADTDLVHLDAIQNGTGGFAINGIEVGDHVGQSVTALGDVNADGLDDLLIGASFADGTAPDSGAAYVVFGKADGSAVNLSQIADGVGGFAILGETTDSEAGFFVSSAGDMNGDGYIDFLIGATSGDGEAAGSGLAYVVFGDADLPTVNLSDIRNGEGGFAILGQNGGDDFGYSVSGGGDVNGDGFDDLLIGAPYATVNGAEGAGAAVVIFGGNLTGAVTQVGTADADSFEDTAANEVFYGAQGDDSLSGGHGTDVLSGGAGADSFIVSDEAGLLTIVDFNGVRGDRLDLTEFEIVDFAALQGRMTEVNDGLKIALDSDSTVILRGLDQDVLQASHVIL